MSQIPKEPRHIYMYLLCIARYKSVLVFVNRLYGIGYSTHKYSMNLSLTMLSYETQSSLQIIILFFMSWSKKIIIKFAFKAFCNLGNSLTYIFVKRRKKKIKSLVHSLLDLLSAGG